MNAHGIGMCLTSSSTSHLGIRGTNFWRLRAETNDEYYGSGYYGDGIGASECNQSCFYSNWIKFGTAFNIDNFVGEQRVDGVAATECPGYPTTGEIYGVIYFYKGTQESEISNTNVSHSHITQDGVYRLQEGVTGKCQFSLAAGNVGKGVLSRVSGSMGIEASDMNFVGNTMHSNTDAFIYQGNSNPFSLTNSICIQNNYSKLSDYYLDVSSCLFYDCPFQTSTSIPTTDMTPTTYNLPLLTDWDCLKRPPTAFFSFTLKDSFWLYFVFIQAISDD